jgi:hypothetical protein
MDHMKFLADIAASDVAVLEVKEGTYKGSWKKAGGRSAWFMMRRNMDRLITMLAPPNSMQDILQDFTDHIHGAKESGDEIHIDTETLLRLRSNFIAEDIFAKIEEHPGGEDGTVLACLRDLRRYLLLIEAEMIARWVKSEQLVRDKSKELMDIAERGVSETSQRESVVMRATSSDDPRRKPTVEELEAILREPDTPVVVNEDGSVSAVSTLGELANLITRSERRVPRYGNDIQPPWVATSDFFVGRDSVLRDRFWHVRAPGVWVLEPHVESDLLPRGVHGYYKMNSDHSWTLAVRQVPIHLREYFPDLAREKNMKEHEELPEWQRMLYAWNEEGQKFCLTENNLAWHVEK